uniref:VWF/SSPO/Zonadhesin-like cysteine-rich domain-containing protein n=1 Tax=Knipowitschia caucasica TaxID=637954 RepID=A0AAV2IZ94_KNICA
MLPKSLLCADTCRTFGSGVVQPFDGRPFHVRSDCPFTLLTSTHNKVECAITTRRGGNGLLTHAQIVINKIKTDLRQGSIYVSGESIQLPYDHKYQHIFPYGIYTKLRSTVFPLSVFWHTVPGGIDTLWACRQFFSYTLDCLRNTTSEYIQLCEENICGFEENQAVGCSFFREIVRLCGKSHFLWDIWRDLTHCGAPECPGELFYAESGPAFVPSCSNQQIDSSELTSSCVCPSGLVLDDHHEGAPCVSVSSCSCVFNHHLYKPGDTRSNRREACLCSDGEWKCTPLHFPPVCVIEGLYVTTLDGKPYVLGEGCSFVAAKACVQRTCSCRSNLHECLCSALSSYVKACTRLGVEVGDWRMATNCTVECLGNQEFSYHVMACNRTCRSLSGTDLSCLLEHIPVEGCGCPEGTHLNHELSCSSKAYCECHYNGGTTPPGPAVINGRQW